MTLRLSVPCAAFALAAAVLPASLHAETTDSQKLDSLMDMSRQLVRTVKNDPLADKSYGVEFNFVRLLLLKEQFSLSGGVSIFHLDRHAEISLPFFYSRSESTELDPALADGLADIDFTEFTQDIHYRRFLGNTQNGFYLSGFSRFAFLDGILGQTEFDNFGDTTSAKNARATEGKLGIGVGLGYRKFSYGGLYWGTSLNLGRYIIGKNDIFRNGFISMDNDLELILDIELFKFGWAF